MATAAELGENRPHGDLRQARTPDDENPLLHAHSDDQGRKILHIPELVGEHRQVADKAVDGGMGQGHVDAADVEHGAGIDQLVEQGNLFGGEILLEIIGNQVEIGAMFPQIGGGLEVAHGR